jgi:hypothetical protein
LVLASTVGVGVSGVAESSPEERKKAIPMTRIILAITASFFMAWIRFGIKRVLMYVDVAAKSKL